MFTMEELFHTLKERAYVPRTTKSERKGTNRLFDAIERLEEQHRLAMDRRNWSAINSTWQTILRMGKERKLQALSPPLLLATLPLPEDLSIIYFLYFSNHSEAISLIASLISIFRAWTVSRTLAHICSGTSTVRLIVGPRSFSTL
jgi:hypothetical protein